MSEEQESIGGRKATPNAGNFYEVKRRQLPLHCPLPDASLWNSHPRVFLPIEATGEAKCAYCGALYRLVEDDSNDGRAA